MNFRNGYLGACIVILGIIITIVSSYALSIEISDEEVTKYSYVTDLNGLFDSQQSPTYIEYSPSTNYTGYYTDQSIVFDGKMTFGGVDYNPSELPNAYRLNLMPENYDTGTLNLSGSDWTSGAHVTLMTMTRYTNSGNVAGYSWGTGSTGTDATLSSVITSMNLASNINIIKINSVDGLSALVEPTSQDSPLELNWVLFSSKEVSWYGDALRVQTQEYRSNYPEDPQYKSNSPMLSCSVDLSTNLATLYYDNEFKTSGPTYNVDDIIISFGGSGTGLNALHLGTTAQYEVGTKPPATYLNIKDGVSVEESS